MDFTHKKTYKKNQICENFYINDIEVDKHIYDTLDDDEFEINIKNVKAKRIRSGIDEKQETIPLCQTTQDPNGFYKEIIEIVNYIKISNVNDCVDKIVQIIDAIGEEQFKTGYVQALLSTKSKIDEEITKKYRNVRKKGI